MNGDKGSRCAKAFDALARLSLAEPSSVLTPLTTSNLIFVNAGRKICLDERPPSDRLAPTWSRGDPADVRPPAVKRRVEPQFPESAREAMGPNASVLVVVEALITESGCVRSVRLVSQSPFPEINGAAVLAIQKWEFSPALMNGEPVDVVFNLTVNFKRQ